MNLTRIYFRAPDWPDNRPDHTDDVPDNELEATKAGLAAHGLIVTGTRQVPWQEQLASMENPEL